MPFYKNKYFELTLFRGETDRGDILITGFFNDKRGKRMLILVKYEGMEQRDLTLEEKNELIKAIDSVYLEK